MKAICNNTDLTALIAHGYSIKLEPQYGGQMTAIDGKDYTAKLRDRAVITLPFLPLTRQQLHDVLQLFPATGAYVTWTYDDPDTGADRTVEMKYEDRTVGLKVRYRDGTEYWDGLVLKLTER